MRKFFSFGTLFSLMFILFVGMFMLPATGAAYGGDTGCVLVADRGIMVDAFFSINSISRAPAILRTDSRGQENVATSNTRIHEVIRPVHIRRIGTAPMDSDVLLL